VKVLSEITEVIRSKNAGPFVVTFDVLFTTEADYHAVEAAGLVTRRAVSELYGVSENELLSFEFYPFAHAIKFSIKRPVGSGAPGDSDVYGAQQHAPLLDLPALP
jgi:hypothetical protein